MYKAIQSLNCDPKNTSPSKLKLVGDLVHVIGSRKRLHCVLFTSEAENVGQRLLSEFIFPEPVEGRHHVLLYAISLLITDDKL